MKKHIIIAIRYSIVQEHNKSWRAANANYEEYISKILNEERLSVREATFKKITLASLTSQTISDENVSYSVLIMISDLLPKSRIAILKNIIETKNVAKADFSVVTIQSGKSEAYDYKNINEAIKSEMKKQTSTNKSLMLATVRLDDDDGLSTSFIDRLSNHMKPGLTGYAVSFAYGVEGYFDERNGMIHNLRHSYFPKNAFGLAYINEYKEGQGLADNKAIHVYNLGNHMKIDEVYPTIVDATSPMYFRTLSNTNDSVGSPYHKHLPPVAGHNTLSNFKYLSHLLDTKEILGENENVQTLDICKSSSPWNVLITHLNERIQLREKQIREMQAKLDAHTL